MIVWQQLVWQRTTLLTDKAEQFANAKTYVFSDSVLCMGGISPDHVSAWKEKINWFMESRQFWELDRIDGEPMEFWWKISSGFTAVQILAEIQRMMTEIKCEPEQFQGRIIFMSMYYDIVVWEEKGNRETVVGNSLIVADYARKFAQGHRSSFGLRSEQKWCATHENKPNGEWDKVADIMMINFSECGHPVFRRSSAFERGDLKSRGKGQLSVHFNGNDETVEVILRTVFSVNQLCFYGAVADMCGEVDWEISKCSKGAEKPVALDNHGHATRSVDNRSKLSDRCQSTGKLVA